MLFNSDIFLFAFLPTALAGTFLLGALGWRRPAMVWLIAASLVFYSWNYTASLAVLGVSLVANYGLGRIVSNTGIPHSRRRLILALGVAANLAVLGWFKYYNFFAANVAELLGVPAPALEIFLPLGISFFTFQKIAYLVDNFQSKVGRHSFLDYALFIVFFPQLIAGPIVHHAEIVPQLQRASFRFVPRDMAIGLSLLAVGLFKKVIIADRLARLLVDPTFAAADAHGSIAFIDAWLGAVGFGLQIYFDFSGYSDMALGLGAMFGLRLPQNFNSPYKAVNIVEFWRRWHMTLSRFLRDYLYIPLGGNKHGRTARYRNLMTVMLLGGLWHGAGWNFVVWGGLHGLYLGANHGWHALRRQFGLEPARDSSGPGRWAAVALTFVVVTVAWVFFRARSWAGSAAMISGMIGDNGFGGGDTLDRLSARIGGFLPHGIALAPSSLAAVSLLAFAGTVAVLIWLLPNSQQWVALYDTTWMTPVRALGWRQRIVSAWQWRPTAATALVVAGLMIVCVLFLTGDDESFIYFQF